MATMNVSIPDPMKTWVEEQAQGGRVSNSSDYVRYLIRRDQDRSQAVEQLLAAVTTGVESGRDRPFDWDRSRVACAADMSSECLCVLKLTPEVEADLEAPSWIMLSFSSKYAFALYPPRPDKFVTH
ncbi:type II toxin-antitoxin system ParD family antitoxin [Paracoccus litorisediminis]|uniref:Type II toxin-antitoxin system ParD family antitoxin n=1 Tax=Paracoccus litorisediminis TaxID=2006130 RepID=A0A844HN39_9RHOB|nr:type II toxin-antitoxin system ParD family antitoxin [Paracoccus litorisediminis]